MIKGYNMTDAEELAIKLTKACWYSSRGVPEAEEQIDRLKEVLSAELALIAAENGYIHDYNYDPEVAFNKAMETAESMTNGKYTA